MKKKFDLLKVFESKWFDLFPFVGFMFCGLTQTWWFAGVSAIIWLFALAVRFWGSDYYKNED